MIEMTLEEATVEALSDAAVIMAVGVGDRHMSNVLLGRAEFARVAGKPALVAETKIVRVKVNGEDQLDELKCVVQEAFHGLDPDVEEVDPKAVAAKKAEREKAEAEKAAAKEAAEKEKAAAREAAEKEKAAAEKKKKAAEKRKAAAAAKKKKAAEEAAKAKEDEDDEDDDEYEDEDDEFEFVDDDDDEEEDED